MFTLASFLAAFLGSCDDEPAPVAWPAGTVVAVDSIPITADEIARDVATVILVEPQWNEVQLKRLAFNELALPRALLRAEAPAEERAEARRALDLEFARIVGGSQVGPPTTAGAIGHEVSGWWKEIGLGAWGVGMNLAPGVWSDVIEDAGKFQRIRVLERIEGPLPAATRLRLDTISVPYKAGPASNAANDELLKAHRLTIVDPAWETIVPERTQFLMGGDRP